MNGGWSGSNLMILASNALKETPNFQEFCELHYGLNSTLKGKSDSHDDVTKLSPPPVTQKV